MIFLTHAALGLLMGLIITRVSSTPVAVASFITAVVFASLLPDIDVGTSFLGKHLKPWNSVLKHRGFFHSIPAMIAFAIIAFAFLGHQYYALAIIIGYASHLALDSLNPAGVRWFWPSKLSFSGRYKTGGIFDWLTFLALAAACVSLAIFF